MDEQIDTAEELAPRGDEPQYRPCAGLDRARAVQLAWLRDQLEWHAYRAEFASHVMERALAEQQVRRLQARIAEERL